MEADHILSLCQCSILLDQQQDASIGQSKAKLHRFMDQSKMKMGTSNSGVHMLTEFSLFMKCNKSASYLFLINK